jgi:predicted hydrolase (HD superfamily)
MHLLLPRKVFGNLENEGKTISKDEAKELLTNWVLNPKLLLHMQQVGYLMKCWAIEKEVLNENEVWKWQMAGLLHDADWDQWPEQHCLKILTELENRKVCPSILHAISAHGHLHFGVEPQTQMAKLLYALDELSGFIHAYSLMRPSGYEGMDVKGVNKRLKEKTFAANVSREDIVDACQRANLEQNDLIAFIIKHQNKVTDFMLD